MQLSTQFLYCYPSCCSLVILTGYCFFESYLSNLIFYTILSYLKRFHSVYFPLTLNPLQSSELNFRIYLSLFKYSPWLWITVYCIFLCSVLIPNVYTIVVICEWFSSYDQGRLPIQLGRQRIINYSNNKLYILFTSEYNFSNFCFNILIGTICYVLYVCLRSFSA